MLRSAKDLTRYHTRAVDGDIGAVKDLYFDDSTWLVRYLVVATGTLLPGRKVLIARLFLDKPDWTSRTLHIRLPKEDIKNSPNLAADEPVSRQMEHSVRDHFQLSPAWGSARAHAATTSMALAADDDGPEGDPHLRSLNEVCGYYIEATDGDLGHAEDFILDDKDWRMRYLVVDTRNWLPGRHVLVSLNWIQRIDYPQRKVIVDLDRETLKDSPQYDPTVPVNREYEARLYDFYGRPKYWE